MALERADSVQVVTRAADGTDPQWLGTIGHFTQLTYSYTLPGGPDQLSGTLMLPGAGRSKAIDAGRQVQAYRGGLKVWDGKLDESAPTAGGWQIQAHGAGTFGADFMAEWHGGSFTSDEPVNNAITRGLRWVNPGIGSGSNVYLLQPSNSASVSITDHMNNITGPAGSTWYVGRNNVLTVSIPAWNTPNRILVATVPATRSLYGYPTVMYARYQSGTSTFATTSVTNTANATRHGNQEYFIDLSAAGTQTAGAVQATLTSILAKYVAASYGDTFTIRHGQLLTMGGAPVDLASEQAGFCAQLVFGAGGYGGEIVPALPVCFTCGTWSYDDTTQTGTAGAYQNVKFDLNTLLANWVTLHPPKP
jgi:hypothetical protein